MDSCLCDANTDKGTIVIMSFLVKQVSVFGAKNNYRNMLISIYREIDIFTSVKSIRMCFIYVKWPTLSDALMECIVASSHYFTPKRPSALKQDNRSLVRAAGTLVQCIHDFRLSVDRVCCLRFISTYQES